MRCAARRTIQTSEAYPFTGVDAPLIRACAIATLICQRAHAVDDMPFVMRMRDDILTPLPAADVTRADGYAAIYASAPDMLRRK